MKIKMLMAFVALLLFSAFTADRTITIFMIGDSTMANKPLEGGNQERGWGHVLGGYFSENIRVENHARNGRSSKSFIDEGLWEVVINKVKPGDYVFIQFGHNDEKVDEKRHTDPGSTFDANLRRFVKETRAKGGIPVLFNAIVRRNFRNNKNAVAEDDVRKDLEGMQTMRTLGENMAWLLQCIAAGRKAGVPEPVYEAGVMTNFIR